MRVADPETLYGLVFYGTLGAIALWEAWAPHGPAAGFFVRRWLTNGALLLVNTVIGRWFAALGGIALSTGAADQGVGILNQVALPHALGVGLAVPLLDLNRYLQHIALHRIPLLWRIHRAHHSDIELDFTTQFRFHPLEALYSLVCYGAFILLFGLPAEGVFLYSLLVAGFGFFQHGNIRLWRRLDAALGWLVITPGLHRIHHSALPEDHNANFAAVFSVWDRIFGTFLPRSKAGSARVPLGLPHGRDADSQRLRWVLADPFTTPPRSRPRAEST